MIRIKVAKAIRLSERIITFRRFQRSIQIPAMGEKKILGSSPSRVAVAKTVAEPVDLVKYQIKVNWTSALPNKENACPVQTTRNRRAQFAGIAGFFGFVSNCFAPPLLYDDTRNMDVGSYISGGAGAVGAYTFQYLSIFTIGWTRNASTAIWTQVFPRSKR